MIIALDKSVRGANKRRNLIQVLFFSKSRGEQKQCKTVSQTGIGLFWEKVACNHL